MYFQTHPKEREALLKSCANDPGTLGNTPECVNVEQAEAIEGIGSFRNLPPLHFSSTPGAAAKKGTGASDGRSATEVAEPALSRPRLSAKP